MKYLLLALVSLFTFQFLGAQELNCSVKVNVQKLQTVDPAVFETLEQTIIEFMNNQQWTEDYFEATERINCNILLTIQEEVNPTNFKADLAIQASRPVYGSNYQTTLINHLDKGVTFTYEQFQPLQFSLNVFNDNLSAVLSFYAHIILGADYDSFKLYGGEEYYQKAMDIVNNIPQSFAAANPGWRSLDGNQNRFWMIENILSPRVRSYREAMYQYHRLALDVMSDDINGGRSLMATTLGQIQKVNSAYPNSMIVQMFLNAKGNEIVEIFKKGTRDEQNRVIGIMTKIDAPNAAKYREIR
ncbi:MAG: DUF4835 family protein [Bacteroidota bacterium]